MSLARHTRDHVLSILSAAAPVTGGGLSPAELQPEVAPYTPAADLAAQRVAMQLRHDLRRLKEIKSLPLKIAAKREMIPAYAAWVAGQLAAGEAGTITPTNTPADDVLPTMMVWAIDTGAFDQALQLAAHVLRHAVKLPARYERDAATLVVEEIADLALKAQNRSEPFPLEVLEAVEALVDGIDMHDQPKAKLLKAIGTEIARRGDASKTSLTAALSRLNNARQLDDRIGVTTIIKGLEKAMAALAAHDAGTTG